MRSRPFSPIRRWPPPARPGRFTAASIASNTSVRRRRSLELFGREGHVMDETKSDDAAPGRPVTARQLAEQGLQQQAVGNDSEAERLLAEAQAMDADTMAEVLREHDAGRAPDARLQDAADQDVERVLPRIAPGPVTG